MASRDLILLHPVLREKCQQFLDETHRLGIPTLITCTGRSFKEQGVLWMQGRQPLSAVNEARAELGLYLLQPHENRKVTWTMNSQHIINGKTGWCSAFDFCLLKGSKAHWDLKVNVNNNELPDYEEAGLVALELGLDWGGRWARSPDYPHCQLVLEDG